MTYEFRCEKCTQRYQAKEEWAGKKTKCKKCGAPIEIPFPPLELPEEVTPGGSVVHRHEPGNRDFEMAVGDSANIQRISEHIEKWQGPVAHVMHELVSDMVHIDLHVVEPTEERPWYSVVTSGMSDRPMNAPEEVSEFAHLELMVNLPADWPMEEKDMEDMDNYWPLRALKWLARFPHEYETWIFDGHTIPNGNPPEPISDDVGFCCFLLLPSVMSPEEYFELKIDSEKSIYFLSLYPLYENEMNFKLEHGTDALLELFDKYEIHDVINPDRPDVTILG